MKTSRWHVGVYIILLVLGVRCTVSVDPFPAWSGDPFELEAPITGITPAFSLGLDVLTLLAAGLVLWARREVGSWVDSVLLAGGAAAVGVHTLGAGASLEDVVQGSQWLAAVGAGVACMVAAREAVARRVILSAVAGLLMFLVVRGGYQVFVEHPMVYKEFLRNKSQIISAQGWNEGSPMALAYERRIQQAEATGWFGLSNVYATAMAVGVTLLGGLALGAWREARRGAGVVVLVAAAAACGVGVYLSQSNGGGAAAVLVVGLLAVFTGVRGKLPWRVGVVAGLMIPLAALAAVAVRGAVGERIGELSLLFRWFYLQGAGGIIADHWLVGVGPAGFKDAYMLVKPALSPEDVSSPHSVYFDFVAALGVGGAMLAALVAAWGARAAGVAASRGEDTAREGAGELRPEVRGYFVLFAAITAVGALFEHRIATVDGTFLRVLSLAAATAVAGAVAWGLRLPRSDGMVRIAAAAAGLVGLTHAQIELTGVTAGANMLVFVLLGVAAGPALAGAGKSTRPWLALVVLACAVVPLRWLAPVARWDMGLRGAAEVVAPVRELGARLNTLAQGRAEPGDSARALATDLSGVTGQRVSEDPASMIAALEQVRLAGARAAAEQLTAAASDGPADFGTVRAASRVWVLVATLEAARGNATQAAESGRRGVEQVEQHVAEQGDTAAALAWLGLVRRTLHELGLEAAERLEQAKAAYLGAAGLAPYEPMYRVEAARIAARQGRAAEAAGLAAEALRLSEGLRLDPVRQLGDRERAELEGLVRAGVAGPGAAPGGAGGLP